MHSWPLYWHAAGAAAWTPHTTHLYALLRYLLRCCAVGVAADCDELRRLQPTREQAGQRTPVRMDGQRAGRAGMQVVSRNNAGA